MAAGIPCSRYQTVGQAIADPQTEARGLMQTVEDAAGPFKVPNPPYKFSDGTVGVSSTVASAGQHTKEVLTELGGVSESELDALLAANLVFADNRRRIQTP